MDYHPHRATGQATRIARWLHLLPALIALSLPACAHTDECLGHHWSSPEYLVEIRFQLALMVAAGLAAAAYALVSRLWRSRRCG